MRALMFRHAERMRSDSSNPPLSQRGLLQAQALCEELKNGLLPQPTALWCSPKLRAQQTFLPLSQKINLKIEIFPDLNERESNESPSKFDRRVENFLTLIEKKIGKPEGVVFFVTHADWIDTASQLIPGDTNFSSHGLHAWPPAQSAEFEIHSGVWHFLKRRNSNL